MKYYKKFADLCAAFTAFNAILFLFSQYMTYKFPEEIIGLKEKLKLFFDKVLNRDNRDFALLILLLVLYLAVSSVFKKIPFVTFAFSLLPMAKTLVMFKEGMLKVRPMLYIVLGIIYVTSSVIYAVGLDRGDGKRRAFACTQTLGIMIFLFGYKIYKTAKEISLITEENISELTSFQKEIYWGLESDAQKLILKIAVMVIISVAVSLLLRDIYFVDAALALIPFVYTIYLFCKGTFKVFPEIFFGMTFFYLASRVLILLSEPMKAKKQKKKEKIIN